MRKTIDYFEDDVQLQQINQLKVVQVNTAYNIILIYIALLMFLPFLTYLLFFLNLEHKIAKKLLLLVEVQQMLFLFYRQHSVLSNLTSINIVWIVYKTLDCLIIF